MKKLVTLICISLEAFCAHNQTPDLTPVIVDGHLPFSISVELADFMLPQGIQSAAYAQLGSQVLVITGRTNGLHGFNNDNNNFPPNKQNTNIFVIDLHKKTVHTRSLYDPLSGLTQKQIDSLSVTSPQSYQKGNVLYMTGGYGVDTHSGTFSTKPMLTALNVPGLMHWVTNTHTPKLASQYIRQISDPVFQITGGAMYQIGNNPTLLIMGHNFAGSYKDTTNGTYTNQVRRFRISDNGKDLKVTIQEPTKPDPRYRRRDFNVVPIMQRCTRKNTPAFVALSGVFTLNTGIWTVPIEIAANGDTFMLDPHVVPTAFKQSMNNYNGAHIPLLTQHGDMYIILFGGITHGYFKGGTFLTDDKLPFTNHITAIKRSKEGQYTHYLLPNQFPTILSTASNPGNPLLFGVGSKFIPEPGIPMCPNGVLKLDHIKRKTVIGYIIGGVQSTLPHTNSPSDSAASPYIFKVTLTPCCR